MSAETVQEMQQLIEMLDNAREQHHSMMEYARGEGGGHGVDRALAGYIHTLECTQEQFGPLCQAASEVGNDEWFHKLMSAQRQSARELNTARCEAVTNV